MDGRLAEDQQALRNLWHLHRPGVRRRDFEHSALCCVTSGKVPNLSEQLFLIHKMGLAFLASWSFCEGF